MSLRSIALVCSLLLLPLASVVPAQGEAPRPIVGINMNVTQREGSTTASFSLTSTYVDAVVAAGGVPVLLPAVVTDEHVAEYCRLVDAFVFVGGPDINPKRFGQEPHATWNPIVERREEFDFKLMAAALETKKPVLAVCLGMQELAVLGGGDMVQDIPSLTDSTIDHRPEAGATHLAHDIAVVPGTKLHQLLGSDTLKVNSLHHQACSSTGPGMIVSARAPDGIVEAIEVPDHPFAIGVQWHPEFLAPSSDPHARIFGGLIAEAREQAAARAAKVPAKQ